jgi:hypothetical protein
MYAKCGNIADASKVFNRISSANTWITIILEHGNVGKGRILWNYLDKCNRKACIPNLVTFVQALIACADIVALEKGRCVHEQKILRGTFFVWSTLLIMYAKYGKIKKDVSEDAISKLKCGRHAVAYLQDVHVKKALELLDRLCEEGIQLKQHHFCLTSASL